MHASAVPAAWGVSCVAAIIILHVHEPAVPALVCTSEDTAQKMDIGRWRALPSRGTVLQSLWAGLSGHCLGAVSGLNGFVSTHGYAGSPHARYGTRAPEKRRVAMLITVRGSRGRTDVGMECSRAYHIVVLRALLAAAGALVSVLVRYHQARCELRATRRGEYLAVSEISEPLLRE